MLVARRSDRRATADVVQSTSTSIVDEELPPRSMARNLAARFQQMEQENASVSSPSPVSSRPATGGHSAKASTGGAHVSVTATSATPVAEKTTKVLCDVRVLSG